MSHQPNPEFQVNCLMCEGSFTATADTLKELVELVAVHLQYVRTHHDDPHRSYLDKHTSAENQAAWLLKNYPNDPSAILHSHGFSWDILGLVPYTRIFKVVETPLPTNLPSQPMVTPKPT